MPRVKSDSNSEKTDSEQSWQMIIGERIRKKKVVPIVSYRVGADHVLGGYETLLDAYVEYVLQTSGLVMERQDFPEMMQIRSVADDRLRDAMAIKDDFINFIRNRLFDLAEADGVQKDTLSDVEEKFDMMSLSDFAGVLGYPRFGGREDPFLLLTSFDLPIYITTSPHDFLEKALRLNGKEPRTEICRWHPDLAGDEIPSIFDGEYDPGADEFKNQPLVYHLYGYDQYDKSLVLTEDDYMRFLVATARDVGRSTDPVPRRIRQAMSDSSLLLLGYNLQTWELRALFWGLIEPRTQKLAGAVNVQLEPSEMERRYLQRYMQNYHQLEVFWGDVQTALAEIRTNI